MFIGLSLSIGALQGTGEPPVITADPAPAPAQMVPGQLLSTLPAGNVNTANYASAGGTISSATYQTQEGGTGAWTSRATSYAVEDLQAVRVLVTDSNNETRAFGIDGQVTYAAPAVDTAGSIAGTLTAGSTITHTIATFTGGGDGVTSLIQSSTDNATWSDTGDTLTTTAVEGEYYRGVTGKTTSGGTATDVTTSIGPIVASTVTLTSVGVTATPGTLDVDLVATGLTTGDTLSWSLVPAAGGAAVDTGTFTWPDQTVAVATGLTETSYVLVITFGSDSVQSAPFDLEYASATWAFTEGDGQVIITSSLTPPAAPTVTAGDGQATLETV